MNNQNNPAVVAQMMAEKLRNDAKIQAKETADELKTLEIISKAMFETGAKNLGELFKIMKAKQEAGVE